MAKLEEIVNTIEKIAPLVTQEIWDNSGWQIRLQKKEINKIMLCVSVTPSVLQQTMQTNCDMIVAHHPMFFDSDVVENNLVNEIVKKHIPVYSIHTPFDKTTGGTTDSLMRACNLSVDGVLNEYTKFSCCEMKLSELADRLKSGLNIDNLKITNYLPDKIVKKIAFCAGSGTSFCKEVELADCDCFVTADVKYHTALDFQGVLIDVGHLESEKPSLQMLKETLDFVECEIAQETSPIQYV